MDDRQTAARDAALAMVAQVEHQALDIAGAYRDGAGITDRFGDFRLFIDKLGQFQIFVDLVETRLSALEPEKQALQARNLADIRWRLLLLEIAAARVFLDRMAASGRPWPLGSRDFLARRLQRLDEIVAFHETYGAQYGLTPPDAALLRQVRDALRQQLGHSPALEDFSAAAPEPVLPSAPVAPQRRRTAPKPVAKPPAKPAAKPSAPVLSAEVLALPVRHDAVGEDYYLQNSANSVVSEACRVARISLDDLARRLNISRSSLVLMLNGSDQIATPALSQLRAFVRQHLKAGAA